ncbi:MAG: C39 family peptidase [Eggerthellaceae bacterium]|nr:C39 family peptidase [Eggerthellaceae bacterium]
MLCHIKKSSSRLLHLVLFVAAITFLVGLCAGFAYADDSQQTPNLAAGSVDATENANSTDQTSSSEATSVKPYKKAGTFYITVGKSPKKVLGMLRNDRTNDTRVVVSRKANTNLLKFRLIRTGETGRYFIKNISTGRLLSVDTRTKSKSKVTMRTEHTWKSQKWDITVNEDNTVSFTNALTKTMLTAYGDKPIIGAKLSLKKANVKKLQRFSLVKTTRNKNEKVEIKVPCYMQNPQLPTGCESVALVNALNYWGFGLSKTSIANKWMPYGSNGVYNFIGNPRDSSGWIICAPGIAKTAKKFLRSKDSYVKAKAVKGESLKSLRKYIAQGCPVIVWTTIGMGSPGRLAAYRSGYPLRYNNHAVVLCGYDPESGDYKVADSLRGTVWRSSKRFTSLYNIMGKQAVVLYD